jgi:hypothetical protein
MHNYYLPRPKQLLRDDDTAQRIGDSSAGVADDVGVAFFKTESARGIWE